MRHGCWWLLLMGVAAGDAGAQAVYRCAAAQGVAYQAVPCAGATLGYWERAELVAVPGPRMPRDQAQREIEQTRAAWQASLVGSRPRIASRLRSPRIAGQAPTQARVRKADGCERARDARTAAHARRGLRWSFDDASRWDAKVFKACRWG